jgi:malate synthase
VQSFEKMAKVVDAQNASDPAYHALTPSSAPFRAAMELVAEGRMEPNGYTEQVLHRRRRQVKSETTGVRGKL